MARGRGRDSRSPSRNRGRGGDRRAGGGGRRSRSRDDRRSRRSRSRENRYRARSRSPRRDRSRSRSGGRRRAPAPRAARNYMPSSTTTEKKQEEKKQEEPEELVTAEQKAASVECDGHFYATVCMTPPEASPHICEEELPRYYLNQDRHMTVPWAKIPKGWELAPCNDSVIEKVVKPHAWGTHLLIFKDSKAYRTNSGGGSPGGLEMIWGFERSPRQEIRLEQKEANRAKWHGRIVIRTQLCFISS
eukprot:TRINITY_DN116099_c0_g1_i1.p1 TRINITY_DN116099_c0_g1~~TRINITY_DN116099_c0_g1_i1.p1  ORF type:complete len:246 (+),score=38.54 TRINITY_DN116099_c0_g1_i1:121-858(+)